MGGPDPRGRSTHHGREVLSHPPSRRRCCGREVEKVAKIGDVHNRVTVPPVYKGRPLAGDYCGDNGLDVEAPHHASTGFVLARHAWGQGYATEATSAMAALADRLGIGRLYALCHPHNRASVRVLQKAGFTFEGVLRRHTIFPNLDPAVAHDVESWWRLGSA
jgi:RimJ/RimL family protein N-acetyltransferase